MSEIEPGAVFVVDNYPFVLTTFTEFEPDAEGFSTVEMQTWKPGHEYVEVGPEGEADAVCDGYGKQILTVVSTHKPGKFPERVFYTREWEDPDGKRFTSGGCKIAVKSKFMRLASGYGVGIRELEEIYLRAPTTPNKETDADG